MTESVLLAAAGGFLVNILKLLELSSKPREERPDFGDIFYWVPYLAWPLLGGLLAYVYQASGISLSPILALNVGLSAPLTFRALVQAAPIAQPRVDPGPGA